MKTLIHFLLVCFCVVAVSCTAKKSKSDIEIEFVQDTLNIGYTYWWPQSGPFIGGCGDELSLVFSGTVTKLQQPTDEAGPLYKSQEGIIEINQVFKIKALEENKYINQKFVSTDCFDAMGLKSGDYVLVFCYDYEGAYSIPGEKSILKIDSFEDPLIESIRRYIDTDQNAVKLKKDVGLWAKKGLGRKLQEIIECAEEMKSDESVSSSYNQ